MTRLFGVVCATALVCALSGPVRAADPQQDAIAIVDKAIKALGGEEKLSKVKAVSWKAKGTITFMGNDNPITTQAKSLHGVSKNLTANSSHNATGEILANPRPQRFHYNRNADIRH